MFFFVEQYSSIKLMMVNMTQSGILAGQMPERGLFGDPFIFVVFYVIGGNIFMMAGLATAAVLNSIVVNSKRILQMSKVYRFLYCSSGLLYVGGLFVCFLFGLGFIGGLSDPTSMHGKGDSPQVTFNVIYVVAVLGVGVIFYFAAFLSMIFVVTRCVWPYWCDSCFDYDVDTRSEPSSLASESASSSSSDTHIDSMVSISIDSQ